MGWVLAAYGVTAAVLVAYALQLQASRRAALREAQRRS
jgi:hypothetical protein